MTNEPFSLKHLFEFFVPSQCRCGELLPEALRQDALKEAIGKMSNWFGGCFTTEVEGSFILSTGDIAQERITIVCSNADNPAFKKHKTAFVALAFEMATRLSQESIGHRIDGKMYFADGDASQPCLHKQARFKKPDRRESEVLFAYQSLEGALHRLCDGREQDRLEAVFSLFTYTLGYGFVNKPVATPKWSKELRQMLLGREAPKVIAESASGFKIILIRLSDSRLLLREQRQVIERLLRDDPSLRALFVVTDGSCSHWHFVNVPENAADNRRLLRRFRIESKDQPMRTIVEQFSLLDLQKIGLNASVLDIKDVHDRAFDVEAITREFYKQYKALFDVLQADIEKQTKDGVWAHDFVLQFLNRLMFIYFIQRKRWLGDDPDFLRNFWSAYKRSRQPEDSFVKRWLTVLFFEAFNEKFHGGYDYFPENVRKALQLAPYLNGGLFTRNDLDDKYAGKFTITDSRMDQTIAFLERYNFTVSEDTPLDQEVAVDAEMLGKVYESLVNEKSEAGIFYTPRTEIDMMCRLSLVDYLANHLGVERKPLLYEAVFGYTAEEKKAADEKLCDQNLWGELDRLLQNITVVDPACGSGSFLIGMLQVLDDLIDRANGVLGREETPYQRRKRIIGQSLYGVDVMRWAVDVAELRLWLQLVIETELRPAELKFRPLLPNLTFKIRRGDSLVQELGGINMAHIKDTQAIPAVLKGRLTKLKGEKLKFYNNEFQSKFDSLNDIEREERRLFQDILESRKHSLENRLKETKSALATDTDLLGETTSRLGDKQLREVEAQGKAIAAELAETKKAIAALARAKETPFVWDISFVEIFTGEQAGFDIVIGNPPYVRHEIIADPLLAPEKDSADTKKAYKEKLIRSVYRLWPSFFGVNPERPIYRLNAKNDLYIYFFFHGLALLNSKGSFCFITSNSWLDVGYGKDLQEFLLKHGHVKMVMDSQAKRVFTSAEVNTVITLLSAPSKRPERMDEKVARFIMFEVPFEHAVKCDVFNAIEVAQERCSKLGFRVFPLSHTSLFEQGCEPLGEDVEEEGETSVAAQTGKSRSPLIKVANYIGGKWGGKYLRAPGIYWSILEKSKGKTVRLGDIAEVRRGVTTGAVDFFYLTTEQVQEWGIEAEFLKPAIKTPRDYYSIVIPGSDKWLFWCQRDKTDLRGTNALKYIKWGEQQGLMDVPSCSTRKNWYSLKGPEQPCLLWPSAFFERHIVYECPPDYVADKVFYTISGKIPVGVKAFLNSSVVSLFVEVEGYQLNHGGIFVTTEWLSNLPVFNLPSEKVSRIYQGIRKRDIMLCEDELAESSRRDLNLLALTHIGLGQPELENMYTAIRSYVSGRIHKASRGTTQKGRKNSG